MTGVSHIGLEFSSAQHTDGRRQQNNYLYLVSTVRSRMLMSFCTSSPPVLILVVNCICVLVYFKFLIFCLVFISSFLYSLVLYGLTTYRDQLGTRRNVCVD